MSVPPTVTALSGQTVVQGAARVPEAVREGSPSATQAYATARGFEQMLVAQMSQSMVASSGLEGEEPGGAATEEGSGEAAMAGGAGPVSSLLVQALSEGVMQGGGLGLAGQLSESAAREASARVMSESGGTTA